MTCSQLTLGGSVDRDTAVLPAGLSWGCWGPVCVSAGDPGGRAAGRGVGRGRAGKTGDEGDP